MDAAKTQNRVPITICPSLIERFVNRLKLPYWAGSLLLAVLFGPSSFLLLHYFDTGNFESGIGAFYQILLPPRLWQQVVGLILWATLMYYTLILPRYIRLRLQAAEGKISPLLPNGREQYQRLFDLVSHPGPAVLLAVVIGVSFSDLITRAWKGTTGPFEWLYYLVNLPLTYLAIGTAVWSYVAALWGLSRLGNQPLKLIHGYEDHNLGVRPVGSLSLSISYAYFGLLSLLVLIVIINPFLPQLTIFLVILTVVGAVMFFLPLLGVRRQMQITKRALQADIRKQWLAVLADSASSPAPVGTTTLENLQATMASVKNLLSMEAAERKANAISTWPFDTTILSKLAAIILSLLTAITTSLVVKFLVHP